MTKTIETLVEDIYAVLDDRGGWDVATREFAIEEFNTLIEQRFGTTQEGASTIRMSALGRGCHRQLWYEHHTPDDSEPLPPTTRFKFLYGDVIELLVLSLAKQAGHDVTGCQDELTIAGVKGHRDAVIDGITIDVKSASDYAFRKFKEGGLRESDAFGYIGQLSSYVHAGHQSDPNVHPYLGAFLAVNKVSGEICLDMYDFRQEISTKEQDIERVKNIILGDEIPDRGYSPEADGYVNKSKQFVPNGNMKLGIECSYCPFKHKCYPNLRTFLYSRGGKSHPTFFTKIAKVPNVMEVT